MWGGKLMDRSWKKSEREDIVLLRTIDENETDKIDSTQKLTKERLIRLKEDATFGIEKLTIDRDSLKKKLLQTPPADYNLEPRLEQLKEDIEKIAKFANAENQKKQWEGLKESLEIIEKKLAQSEQDLKDVNQMLELL
jgi:vacuolar-type H+-ATPase subunit I/STV1